MGAGDPGRGRGRLRAVPGWEAAWRAQIPAPASCYDVGTVVSA